MKPAGRRRYPARAAAARLPGFADAEYPNRRSFLDRFAAAAPAGWPAPARKRLYMAAVRAMSGNPELSGRAGG